MIKPRAVWDDVEVLESSNENVKKFIFRNDDAIAEAVLYKYPSYEERTVMCISTQSGCPMGCTFCGTGKYFNRNLTQDEIEMQVLHMAQHMGIPTYKVKNFQIMVMSMGEPVLNAPHVVKSFEYLHSYLPHAKLLISTSAPDAPKMWDIIMDAAVRIPTIGLQFSIHESTDDERNKLIPFRAKLNLEEISKMGERFHEVCGRQPFFNYCVHESNGSADDAENLLALFKPEIWQATLSVICESDQTMASAINEQETIVSEFSQELLTRGYSTRVFNPAGQDDIGGGCGQLWQVQKWAEENPELMKPSSGAKELACLSMKQVA